MAWPSLLLGENQLAWTGTPIILPLEALAGWDSNPCTFYIAICNSKHEEEEKSIRFITLTNKSLIHINNLLL